MSGRFVRIIVNIILLILSFIAPWWLTLGLGVVCIFIFDSFYEIIAYTLIVDSFYNVSLERFYGVQFMVTMGAIVFLLIGFVLKRRLRIYDRM